MPESIRNMIIPPRNSATREPENKNTASQTQEQTTAQVVTTATMRMRLPQMKAVSVHRCWLSKKHA